jgi:dTMP kinase
MPQGLGKFIMIDGIDGSGKTTIVQYWKEYLESLGKKVFDLKSYWKEHDRHPTFEEIKDCDVLFSAEMSYTGIGKVLREELINRASNYPPLAIAEAYALDRLIIYTKLLIPFLKLGKLVISDRGVSTSLAYQSSMSPELTFQVLAGIPGNALALQYAPDHLVIVKIDPEIALARLDSRSDKNDAAIFEKLETLQKIITIFDSQEYRDFFTERRAQVSELSGEGSYVEVQERSIECLKKFLV